MNDMVQRDLGRLDADITTVKSDLAEIKADMKTIMNEFSQLKGGSRVLLGISAVFGGVASTLLHYVWELLKK